VAIDRCAAGQLLARCNASVTNHFLTPPVPVPQPVAARKLAWKEALVGAAIGASVTLGVAWLARSGPASGGDPTLALVRGALHALGPWDLLAVPLLWLLAVLVHELGHLVGGLSQGMRFLLFIVGPFRVRQTASGIKADWYLRAATFGGLVATVPTSSNPPRRVWLALIAGGPVASLVLALLLTAAAFGAEGRVAAYAWLTAAISAATFLTTAIPAKAGGFLTDGRQFIEVLRGGPSVAHRNALTAIFGEGMAGTRPRERDAAAYERALALTGHDPLRDVGTWLLAFHRALDERDFDAASRWIDQVALHHDDYPIGFRQALANEVAFFAARYRQEPERAAQWLLLAEGGLVDPPSRALAQGALAWVQGDSAQAKTHIERGLACLGEASDKGMVALVQDELLALRRDVAQAS
jgi:hypothetical protein